MLVPYIWFIANCLYNLSLPDTTGLSGESKGYAEGYLLITVIPALLSAVGLIGSLLVSRISKAPGILMIIAGAIIILFPASSLALSLLLKVHVDTLITYIPPLMVLAAGILALVSRTKTATTSQKSSVEKSEDTL